MANDTRTEDRTYTEEDVLQRLLELGIINEIKRPVPDAVPRARPLIALEGRPGSRLIIEERR